MTADDAAILRLLEAPAEPGPAAARPLRLVSALSAHGRVARAEGLAGAGVGHEVRLPGIGGRYLAGLAAHAHEQGWPAPEVAALLDAVEGRASMWIVSPSAAVAPPGRADRVRRRAPRLCALVGRPLDAGSGRP